MIDAAQPLCLMNGYTMLAIRGQKLRSTAWKRIIKCVKFLCCPRLTLLSCCGRCLLIKCISRTRGTLHWVFAAFLLNENNIQLTWISHSKPTRQLWAYMTPVRLPIVQNLKSFQESTHLQTSPSEHTLADMVATLRVRWQMVHTSYRAE